MDLPSLKPLSHFLSLSMWGSDGSARMLQRVDAYGDLVVEVGHVNALGLLIWIVYRPVIISSLFMFLFPGHESGFVSD
jgi:hypothetical protein